MRRTLLLACLVVAAAACGDKKSDNKSDKKSDDKADKKSDDRPTHDAAQAACDHQIELGYWEGFDGAIKNGGKDPKDPAIRKMGEESLVTERKGKEWQDALTKCTDGFQSLGTPEQMACVTAAKSTTAAADCLRGK